MSRAAVIQLATLKRQGFGPFEGHTAGDQSTPKGEWVSKTLAVEGNKELTTFVTKLLEGKELSIENITLVIIVNSELTIASWELHHGQDTVHKGEQFELPEDEAKAIRFMAMAGVHAGGFTLDKSDLGVLRVTNGCLSKNLMAVIVEHPMTDRVTCLARERSNIVLRYMNDEGLESSIPLNEVVCTYA